MVTTCCSPGRTQKEGDEDFPELRKRRSRPGEPESNKQEAPRT